MRWLAGLLVCGLPALSAAQGLSALQQTEIVVLHNQARCGVNPPAASMPALRWDETLAAVAQSWANQGVLAHNPNRSSQYQGLGGSGYVGENLALGASTTRQVALWIAERASFNALTNTCATGAVCGHYTQVVWADTVAVGCGLGTVSGSPFLVCNYAPGGNFNGQPPYDIGAGVNDACGPQTGQMKTPGAEPQMKHRRRGHR
jgi:Cysteine-rich secretory protein family